jgi:hypothetical protein
MKLKIWTAVILGALYVLNAVCITFYKESDSGVIPILLTTLLPWIALLLELWITMWVVKDLIYKITTWTHGDGVRFLYNVFFLIVLFFGFIFLRIFVGHELKEIVTAEALRGYFIGLLSGIAWFLISRIIAPKPDDIEKEIYHE